MISARSTLSAASTALLSARQALAVPVRAFHATILSGSDSQGQHKVTLRTDTKAPQVYGRIKQQLSGSVDVTQGLNSTPDHIEALRRAQEAFRTNGSLKPVSSVQGTKHLGGGFLRRLAADGGDKILQLKHSAIHVEYTRFVQVCTDIKGLSLDDALLQLAWHQKPIGKRMRKALSDFILVAKEEGFDLKRTYIAEAFARENKAILSKELVRKYLRGRGRYGATPHIKSALLEVTLQERDKPFAVRENDPLEWVRVRMRNRLAGYIPDAESVYTKKRTARPVKPVYV
ncbi:hypothetical protein BC831DRAFT_446628 [Entophlyctis helioformis]|nr:hypothetical protein BC831DRAFT_446628 [Entophlyctis helioformis]